MIKINTGVCASITDNNLDDIIKTVEKIKDKSIGYIELRLDLVENINTQLAGQIIDKVKEITEIPIILTNRTEAEGGNNRLSESQRVEILIENAKKVEITDIELSTDAKLRQNVIDAANKTIISYHNFNKTPSPDKLQTIIDDAESIGDIAKIAVKPLNIEDTYTIIRLLLDNPGIVAISMDEVGSYTRIFAPILSSPITYASIEKTSAPGQYDVDTTIKLLEQLKN